MKNSTAMRMLLIRTGIASLTLLLAVLPCQLKAQTSVTSGVTSVGYSLNTSAIAVDPGISISSGSSISGFKVTISSGLKSSDVLSYTGTLPAGVTATAYNSSTGVLAFSGSTSAANWQTFLRTITYINTNTAQFGDRTITFSAGNLSAASNGHFYELISTTGTWTASKAAAASRTYLGYTGYLATISSAAENAFIRQVLNADAWIGASDEYTQINTATGTTTYANQAAAEGKWYWVTGPEKGTMFSLGNLTPVTQPGQYANWNSFEPNNAGSEHYGQIYSSGGSVGRWNDLPNVSLAYVVEYGGLLTDPVQTISSNTLIYTNISSNTVSGAQAICSGTSVTGLTGTTPYGGDGTYTYKWISSTTGASSGYAAASGTNNTANYSPGTLSVSTWYRRIVTSGALSDTSAAIAKTVNPAITSTTTQVNVDCNGNASGQAVINVSGGTAGYTYLWSPSGGTAATAGGLAAGTYTCTVTDANACTHTKNYTITQPAALSSVTSASDVNCNGAANGSAAIVVSGGTSSYSYAWSPSGGTASTASNLAAGNYTCVVTDANACTLSANYTISQPSAIASVNSSVNVNCFGLANGNAAVAVSGGTSPYTYAWSGGGTSSSKSGLSAGTYTCTITDGNGCTSSQVFTITQPAAISGTGTQSNVNCNGAATATATVSVSGGTPGYTYNWSPSGGTAATASGLSAGTYTVSVQDANLCPAYSRTFTITEPAAISSTASQSNLICNGDASGTASITVSGGTPGYTYTWTPYGGTAATASGLSAGTYTCAVQDANLCPVYTRNFTITEPLVLSAFTTTGDVSCNGGADGQASVTASGGTGAFTYSWSPSGGSSATASGLTAGNYSCLITDVNGCTVQELVSIAAPAAITATVSVADPLCFGMDGSATVSSNGGSGSISYAWSNGATAATALNLPAGTYTVTCTDANACVLTQNVTITDPAQLTGLISATTPLCNGENGAATFAVSGGTGNYTFLWSSGGTSDFEPALPAGNYTATVTDDNGCTYTESFTMTAPAAIQIAVSSTDPLCNGGTGDATAVPSGGTGNMTYSWSDGSTNNTATNLIAGTYTVQVSDQNGCVETTTVTITDPAAISAVTSSSDEHCNQTDGTATVTASGGTGNLSYLWSTGDTGATAMNLTTGNYTVTITDANACVQTATVTVNAAGVPVATAASTDIGCNGANTGAIDLQVSAGVGNYTYSWSNGATTEDLQGLTAGVYVYTVTDGGNCSATGTITLTEPDPITTAFSTTNEMSGNDGSIDITLSGGTPFFTYLWSNGSTTEDLTGLSAGDYTVTITDGNGCTVSTTITVSSSVGIFNPTAVNTAISVYPNPNKGQFEIKGLSAGPYRITDAIGKTIYVFTVQNDDKATLNLNTVSGGIYFIQRDERSNFNRAKFSIIK